MKITMKNIFLLFICLALFSCDDFLDETPKGKVIPQTVDDMGRMLDDFFGWKTNNIAFGSGIQNLLSDNIAIPAIQFPELRQYNSKAVVWDESFYGVAENDSDWDGHYRVIYICNWILEHIDDAEEGGAGIFNRTEVKASALVHRSFAFFQLVNLYGKHYDAATAATDLGIPMPLISDINTKHARSSVAEVYEQVIADLNLALDELPLQDDKNFRPTKMAVKGLLARVYLYMGDYKKAWQNAEAALNIKGDLIDFNTLSTRQPDFGVNGYERYEWDNPEVLYLKVPNNLTSRGEYLSDDLLNLFDRTNDLRFKNFITNTLSFSFTPSPDYRMSKYLESGGVNMGDMYLILAEGKVRDNDVEGAETALNSLRAKRYLTGTPAIDEDDADALLRLILEERRRETMFQGMRWFDLKRLNKDPRFKKTITREVNGKTYTLEPESNRYVLAIPEVVIKANSLLEQNPR